MHHYFVMVILHYSSDKYYCVEFIINDIMAMNLTFGGHLSSHFITFIKSH